MVYELTGYDTDTRTLRVIEYTRSETKAQAWDRLERIQFTDSGHGIVFSSRLLPPGRNMRRQVRPLSLEKVRELTGHMRDVRRERRAQG